MKCAKLFWALINRLRPAEPDCPCWSHLAYPREKDYLDAWFVFNTHPLTSHLLVRSLACSLSLSHSTSLFHFRIHFENILYECASACAIYCVSNKWRFFILSLYIQDRLCSQFRQIHISLDSTLCIKFAFISRVLRFIFRVVKLFLNIL